MNASRSTAVPEDHSYHCSGYMSVTTVETQLFRVERRVLHRITGNNEFYI